MVLIWPSLIQVCVIPIKLDSQVETFCYPSALVSSSAPSLGSGKHLTFHQEETRTVTIWRRVFGPRIQNNDMKIQVRGKQCDDACQNGPATSFCSLQERFRFQRPRSYFCPSNDDDTRLFSIPVDPAERSMFELLMACVNFSARSLV